MGLFGLRVRVVGLFLAQASNFVGPLGLRTQDFGSFWLLGLGFEVLCPFCLRVRCWALLCSGFDVFGLCGTGLEVFGAFEVGGSRFCVP